jgi:hypothetical protein
MTEMAAINFAGRPDADGAGSFLVKYCKRFDCQAADYEQDVLWRCMFPLSKPLARLPWLIGRGFFNSDLELIAELKSATSYSQVREIVNCYCSPPLRENFARRRLKIRMSKGKLLDLASSVFRTPPARPG